MFYSQALQNRSDLHERAKRLNPTGCRHNVTLQPLRLLVNSGNGQLSAHYPYVLDRAAQAPILPAMLDPNFETFGIFNKPVY